MIKSSILEMSICVVLLAFVVFTAPTVQGDEPIKVFILAGQSNMQGAGAVIANPNSPGGGKGSLEHLVSDPATAEQFQHTVDENGAWIVRDDVNIWYLERQGGLSVGYGSGKDRIGPEFQFGHVMGDHFEEPVLLIKTAWGGKSLQKDFSPPSSGGDVGPFYTEMLQHVSDVLKNMDELFPEYEGRGYEIVGFGWHQGWNDGCNAAAVEEYEVNMANFIRDVRTALDVEEMPFVIANSGFGGWNQSIDRRLGIVAAQAAVAEYDEFEGTVACIETRGFFRPAEESPSRQGYHWNGNAETYFLIGDAMGNAMVEILEDAK
jgi:hypothetical protein